MRERPTDGPSEAEFLRRYDIRHYDCPLVTVDVAIFTVREERLQALLVRRDQHPGRGQWALPGGFIQLKEDPDLEAAARRKLAAETGVSTSYLEQVVTVGNTRRDPRGWSVTVLFFALIASDALHLTYGEGTSAAEWVEVQGEGVARPLAFDHAGLLAAALERLRSKVEYTALPVHLLSREFTLSELQAVFETLLGREVNKAAFRKRIHEAGILEPIEGRLRHGSNRPAQLYRVRAGQGAHFFDRVFARRGD